MWVAMAAFVGPMLMIDVILWPLVYRAAKGGLATQT
jgi:uncharacterized membrane protein